MSIPTSPTPFLGLETTRYMIVRNEESQTKKYLYLPDTMAAWPWPRKINPHHNEVNQESETWFKSFNPFTPESLHVYEKCKGGYLASLAYPDISRDALRTGIDLMNVFFIIEEYTDVEPTPGVREIVRIVIDAINNPEKPRPKGETVLGEITRQFWYRGRTTATAEAAKHFVESFTDYLHSIITQADDRDNNTHHTIETYLETRRENIGARPAFVPGELHLAIPDDAFYHPVVKELEYLVTVLIIIDNDIVSYNKEQATGDDRHNILIVAMSQFNTDFDGAMVWAADYHKDVETRFFDTLKRLPSFGTQVDHDLAIYIEHLANWPRSNDCWNFESGRYFGSKGLEYQRTRLVPMLHKHSRNPTLRRELVELPNIDNLEKGTGVESVSSPNTTAA